jgi:hypothetical protein
VVACKAALETFELAFPIMTDAIPRSGRSALNIRGTEEEERMKRLPQLLTCLVLLLAAVLLAPPAEAKTLT